MSTRRFIATQNSIHLLWLCVYFVLERKDLPFQFNIILMMDYCHYNVSIFIIGGMIAAFFFFFHKHPFLYSQLLRIDIGNPLLFIYPIRYGENLSLTKQKYMKK